MKDIHGQEREEPSVWIASGNTIMSLVLIVPGILFITSGIGALIGIVFIVVGVLAFGATEDMKHETLKQVDEGDIGGATRTWGVCVLIIAALFVFLFLSIAAWGSGAL